MHEHPNRFRGSSPAVALALALVAGPAALATYQQDTPPAGSGTTTPPPAKPKADPTMPPAKPKAEPSTKSFLPRAGASSKPATPSIETSRNPFHAETREMRRQNSRLRSQGFSSNVMNDGEIVLALNATVKLLAKVDDGYGGHRTAAIQEIEAAIKQIQTKTGKSAAKLTTPPHTSKDAMPREEADAHLREAHKSLEKIVFNIGHGGNVKRLGPARDSVKKAIQELNAALEPR